jgi:tRNA threonylcarbamoyladenosine biosynthesis protein TsaB
MRLLAVETSTPAGSVALIQDGGEPLVRRLETGRPQTETLLATIDRLLADGGCTVRELDGFAVAVGPGAFIGVRVGIATVKGLAMGTGKPVVPVSTLEALAMRALEPGALDAALGDVPALMIPHLTICPLIDARRGEVYAACYRPDREHGVVLREGEEALTSPALLLERLTGPVFFLGDGAGLHRALISERLGARAFFPPPARPELMEPSAAAVARLAWRRWKEGGAVDPGEVTVVYFRPAVEPPVRVKAD